MPKGKALGVLFEHTRLDVDKAGARVDRMIDLYAKGLSDADSVVVAIETYQRAVTVHLEIASRSANETKNSRTEETR